MLGCGGLILRHKEKNHTPALSLFALWPQALSAAGRCSLLDFLSWFCYSCTRGTLGLHPVYVVLSITTQSVHQAQRKKKNQPPKKRCCRAPAGQVGGIGATKISVIQVTEFCFQPFRCCCQIHSRGRAEAEPCVPGVPVPVPGHTCAQCRRPTTGCELSQLKRSFSTAP